MKQRRILAGLALTLCVLALSATGRADAGADAGSSGAAGADAGTAGASGTAGAAGAAGTAGAAGAEATVTPYQYDQGFTCSVARVGAR
ncbi:MAG: hypothetical protein R3B13_05885 [Polyangiaceae bacterium]